MTKQNIGILAILGTLILAILAAACLTQPGSPRPHVPAGREASERPRPLAG